MGDFDEVECMRTVRTHPFEIFLRWNSEPFRAVVNKDKDISPSSLGPPFASSRAYYFYRLGLASSFLRALRTDYPFAFLLTNDCTVVSDWAIKGRRIPWSFAWDSRSVESYEGNEGPSVLMNLERGTVGYHMEGLLGLYPYPATYVLLLSRCQQNIDDMESRLKSLSVGDDLKYALLEVSDVLWISGEAEYLLIAARDSPLAGHLGHMGIEAEGT